MIAEQLKKIKQIGTFMESAVTLEDIAAKEQELGIKIPEALCEVYLNVHPDDPIFSVVESKLIPLEALSIREIKNTEALFHLLDFLQDETFTYGTAIAIKDRKSDNWEVPDSGVYCHYTNPKNHPTVHRNRCVQVSESLSEYILEEIAGYQVLACPSILGICKKELWFFGFKAEEFFGSQYEGLGKYGRIVLAYGSGKDKPEFLKVDKVDINLKKLLSLDLDLSRYDFLIGAETDEALEKLTENISQKKWQWGWLKSQTGKTLFKASDTEPPIPEARPLYSIEPLLKFLCEFAGIKEKGLTEGEIQKVEEKLGKTLPLPIKEYYRYMPKKLYRANNHLRSLNSIKIPKSGKLYFLEENQNSCHWGFTLDSPFVYIREDLDSPNEWRIFDYLDGFLVQEFAMEILSGLAHEFEAGTPLSYPIVIENSCPTDSNLVFDAGLSFKKDMMEPGGCLYPHFSDIADLSQKVAWSHGVQLFQALEGKIIALWNKADHSFYSLSNDREAFEKFWNSIETEKK